jgi:thioredoxin reductase (NADPH)
MRPTAGDAPLDALIIGGGPVGLTAALYLGRFKRRFALVDAGEPRAAWIPESHNIPFFGDGIAGPDILRRARDAAARYGARPISGRVETLERRDDGFLARLSTDTGEARTLRARRVLFATGAVDVEPDLPDLSDAVRRGLVRYCPICNGYESRDRRIAVIGHGPKGLGEASFIARTYSDDVTLLSLGQPLRLDDDGRALAARQNIRLVETPIAHLDVQGDRIAALHTEGGPLRFDLLYSALGLHYRNELAVALGAERDEGGALLVDAHMRTTVPGLYAAGDIVRGLDQIVVGMGHAAIASAHIHNHCELPTEDEPREPVVGASQAKAN